MTAARWLSVVLHPFVMVGVMVGTAAAARQTADGGGPQRGDRRRCSRSCRWRVLMWRQVRRGDGKTPTPPIRAERRFSNRGRHRGRHAARVSPAISAAVVLGPWRGYDARHAGVCGLATRWIKVSLHMAFATLAATALILMRSPAASAAARAAGARVVAPDAEAAYAARSRARRRHRRRGGCSDSLFMTDAARQHSSRKRWPTRRMFLDGRRAKPHASPSVGAGARHVRRHTVIT